MNAKSKFTINKPTIKKEDKPLESNETLTNTAEPKYSTAIGLIKKDNKYIIEIISYDIEKGTCVLQEAIDAGSQKLIANERIKIEIIKKIINKELL